HRGHARRARADPRRCRARLGRRTSPAACGRHSPVVSVSIRLAGDADVDFLVELYADEDVRPFLAASGSYDRHGVVARLDQDAERGGVMIVELEGERAGAMAWELANRRSGIVHVSGLAVHPRFRGRRLAD